MDIEQSTLIWIARIVFIIIALLLSLGVWQFMRRERKVDLPKKPSYKPPQHIDLPKKTIILSLLAKPGKFFDNTHLFNVMDELGFAYSSNQIFGYFMPEKDNEIAFRVVNMRRPHTFDKDPSKTVLTNGLLVLMDLPLGNGDNQVDYFHLLLSVLDELHTKLDATLCDENRKPLNNKRLYEIQRDIELFEQKYTNIIQNDYQRINA